METNEKFSVIFKKLPGALLESARFGRSENFAHWISSTKLFEAIELLRIEAGMGWLENISCIQVDQSLVLSYFLRTSVSEPDQETAILRVSFDLPQLSPTRPDVDVPIVTAPSLFEIWPIALEFEREIAHFFGVEFKKQDGTQVGATTEKSLQDWNGFPLRKDFVFPEAERSGGFR